MASFTPPTAFCTLPSVFSAEPSAFNLASPVTLPAASLIAPPACLAEPAMRSLSMIVLRYGAWWKQPSQWSVPIGQRDASPRTKTPANPEHPLAQRVSRREGTHKEILI